MMNVIYHTGIVTPSFAVVRPARLLSDLLYLDHLAWIYIISFSEESVSDQGLLHALQRYNTTETGAPLQLKSI